MSFLYHLINGVSLGSIYAIIALGYTMVYGIAKMLNFAHGDVIMVGAYVSRFFPLIEIRILLHSFRHIVFPVSLLSYHIGTVLTHLFLKI